MKRIILHREVAGLAEYELDAPEMRFPAHILHGNRMTDDEMFGIVKDKFAREGSMLQQSDLYFFPAEISNQNLDSYFTKMAESSLRNYTDDCNAGVAFQNSHKSRELGVGYVFRGEFIEADKRVLADIYTVRGLKLNADLDTDNFIKGIETGMIRDVSIGFKAGVDYKESCNLCGIPYWHWDCRHVAGMMYEMADDPNSDPTNQESNEQMAFVWIENARLSEVSAVYDGSTPDAMILTKARREQRAGRMTESIRMEIQKRFHVDIHEPKKVFPGAKRVENDSTEQPEIDPDTDPNNLDNNRSDTTMTDLEKAQQTTLDAQALLRAAELKTAEAETRATKAESDLAAEKLRADNAESRVATLETEIRTGAEGIDGLEIPAETDPVEVIRSVRSHVNTLAPKAVEFDSVRTAAIDEAVKSGIRLYGDEFNEETRRATLAKLSLAEINENGADWESRATVKFGKRKSQEEGEADPDDETTPTNGRKVDLSIPASAFNRL